MVEFLIYDLKVATLIAVFYMFYRLLLSHDTLHRMNRVVLLTTAVASFVLPLCVITMHHTVVVEAQAPLLSPVGDMTASVANVTTEASLGTIWETLFTAVFFVGVAVTLGYLLWSVGQVVRLIRHSEQHPQADGTIICVTNKEVSPFSWMRYIVLNRKDYESPDPAVMAHERGHIRQHHSLDVLLVDTLTILQWFNPAMWMLRQDLRAIHEYEADAVVLSQGINMRQYQYLLIQKAVGACGYSVANGITHSTLKNRITMMLNNKKTNRKSMFKLLALLPIVGIALALNAETVNDYVYQQPPKKVVKKGRKDGQIKMGVKTIEVKTDEGTLTGENVVMGVGETDTISARIICLDKDDSQEAPLFIIDGKKSTKEQLLALDSKTIDHIDVLKDKAAVELYGEEGKNGVVIVTTKGKKALTQGNAKVDSTKEAEVVVAEAVDPAYEKVFDVVEQMPEFIGGQAELMKFLAENVHYPEAAYKVGKQGRVIVTFIVEADGSVSNAKIVKKVSDELDAEALRVIGTMPKWKPGMQNGKAVRVKYTIPITFRLS
ncbi:MAG: TonB family protein [Prevotella sp.]|nr:TonB family protein [Prevotella sp.]